MKKIVELIVKLWDNEELEDVGVDAVALVENPAIELPFMAFAAEEKFIEPKPLEEEGDFVGRCIPELMAEGYDQEQAAAICYSYYQDAPDAASYSKFAGAIVNIASEYGEEYDPLTSEYIDMTKDEFSTIGDFVKGIGALDLLTKPEIKKQKEGKTMYRYAGRPAQRNFCKAMLRMNKLYTREDIYMMEARAINESFGPDGDTSYSIFSFKGGPNCKHYWEELTVFTGDNNQLILLSHGPVSGRAGQPTYDLPNHGYMNAKRGSFSFSVIDEEQRVVVGPVLIPNKLIRRIDKETGEEYFVYFSEKTVKDIAEMLFERNMQNRTNVEHTSFNTNNDNTLLESWIVDNPQLDKAKALGFEVPKGTLMQSRRINNDKTWQDIKDGKLRGFSVEGVFIEKAKEKEPTEDDQIFAKIMDILKNIK